MQKSRQYPSKREIQKALSDCAFNPREPGPMQIIADVGDLNYYRHRAIEELKNADNGCARKAIQLLALVIAYENKADR